MGGDKNDDFIFAYFIRSIKDYRSRGASRGNYHKKYGCNFRCIFACNGVICMMKSYFITLQGSVTLDVDANDEEEAKEKADNRIANGDFEFAYDEENIQIERYI